MSCDVCEYVKTWKYDVKCFEKPVKVMQKRICACLGGVEYFRTEDTRNGLHL
ncbi:hypothetical protein CY34DRAFT_257366 [Suillus luteus UH-Slu-Lm8-n1]|uniref:Uncharacterized protein n=1 Tax=Suillus luteus UH-Slu-Lm8-n1 TaxID=930992 RepID=A0A0D0ARD3_9AGAM|nr:hypothetical protein CY34DRAFT_257366 [Suillus luteus UH-Slu-Lm8-n1]